MSAEAETLSARERFSKTLAERAEHITSTRNDVFTTKPWQLALNFVMGGGAVALLSVTMFTKGTVATVCAIVGVVVIIALVVYNYTMRAVTPMSFLQYTYRDKGGVTYCFQVLSKTRSGFSDGNNHIETDRGETVRLAERSYSLYSYDFFARMDADMRIADGDRETFKGTLTHNGKSHKCKIVFKNNVPLYGSISGARIKYFDVNNTKDKFVVPAALKRGVLGMGVHFPKLPGLYVRDDIKDATKQ